MKCLFGSNLASQWYNLFPGPVSPDPKVSAVPNITSIDTCSFLNNVPVQLPLLQLHREVKQVEHGLVYDDVGSGAQSGGGGGGGVSGSSRRAAGSSGTHHKLPAAVRPALSAYIRLFEPLVIKALNLYTVSNSVSLQRSVLQLLVCLVHIRVNYCLLDSNQIFLRYVIKQLEHIEEGHLRDAHVLIPCMFEFLVAVSYERQHSRSIITVPKIIQLCDGLLASGQPLLTNCVLALGPLVEEVYVSGLTGGGGVTVVGQAAADAAELATKREVLACTLLRLAHYHQVGYYVLIP